MTGYAEVSTTITIPPRGRRNHSIIPIDSQDKIGWQHFCRGRVSKEFTSAMEKHYSNHPDNPNFTRRGWTKQIIALLLTIHVEEWYFRCERLTSPDNTDDEKMSPEKRSLLLTIKLFYEKIESLPASKRKRFDHSEEEYRKMSVKCLKQWITNTKRLFRTNNEKSKNRKITEFFQNTNNNSVSKIGTPIKKTINQSEPPTTKNYKIILTR